MNYHPLKLVQFVEKLLDEWERDEGQIFMPQSATAGGVTAGGGAGSGVVAYVLSSAMEWGSGPEDPLDKEIADRRAEWEAIKGDIHREWAASLSELAAENAVLRSALRRLEQWDMLTLRADGRGAAHPDAPFFRQLITDALQLERRRNDG